MHSPSPDTPPDCRIARPLAAEGDRSRTRRLRVLGLCLLALAALGLGSMPG